MLHYNFWAYMQLVNVPFSTPDQSHIARMSYNFIIPVLIQIFSFSKFAPVKIYHDIRTGWRLWKEAMITFHKASLCKKIMEHISLLKISTFYWARSEASKGYVFTGICLSKCNMGPGNNTSLPPRLCAGRRYASYWNAFLFRICEHILVMQLTF